MVLTEVEGLNSSLSFFLFPFFGVGVGGGGFRDWGQFWETSISRCLNFLFIFFSFRVLNVNNVGDQLVEKERDSWIEVNYDFFFLKHDLWFLTGWISQDNRLCVQIFEKGLKPVALQSVKHWLQSTNFVFLMACILGNSKSFPGQFPQIKDSNFAWWARYLPIIVYLLRTVVRSGH